MKILPLFLFFLMSPAFSIGQEHLNSTYTDVVFVDSTNIRETPSITGKILGKARHNQTMKINQCLEPVEDKIGATEDSWYPVIFEGTTGYIWRPNFADGVFKSELDPEVSFLINFTQNRGLEFKIFNNNQQIVQRLFEDKAHQEIVGSISLGTTFNSNGKEIIAVALDTIYELFEWDGTEIKPSGIKLQDDSFLTGKYTPYETALINTDKVKVHISPKTAGAILESLNAYTSVELLAKPPVADTVNGEEGYWYAIKRNGKTAYVWSDFIDIPQRYIKSNKVQHESFLYTNNAIYVFDRLKIKQRLPINRYYDHYRGEDDEMFKDNFVQFGNRGLNPDYQIFGICYGAFACGEAGGDDLYVWDGNKLIHLADDFDVGDGGYYSNHGYTFPNEFGGMKNRIIYETSEEYSGPECFDCAEGTSCIFAYSKYELEFNGDTLVEVESEDSRLRTFLADSLPNYQFMHAAFSDLNSDGITDAAFFMEQVTDENAPDVFHPPLIGIVYGTSNGSFRSLSTNDDLVLENYFSVGFLTRNDTLEIKVFYNIDSYSEDESGPVYSQFTFVHDVNYNKLVWYAKVEAEALETEESDFTWEVTNSEKFKKNKVSFANAWESRKK